MFSLAEASHLVGGFLTYRWLGTNGSNTQYRVTLFVYRDCTRDGTSDEVPFDDDIDLCVYSGDKRRYTTYKIKLLNPKKVQPVGNTNCPEVASACLEQGVYETTISLPNSSTGYHLKWERCCRNTQNNLRDQFGQKTHPNISAQNCAQKVASAASRIGDAHPNCSEVRLEAPM